MADVDELRHRGTSKSHMREFTCKDCRREVEQLEHSITQLQQSGGQKGDKQRKQALKRLRKQLRERREKATYNENWAKGLLERGGSRSDRCKDHRQRHRTNIQGMAVAYIDIETVGEVVDRSNPTGPLGGLGELPGRHEVVPSTSYDLQEVNVGMTDAHILEMIDKLRQKQVLILKAGTGTGKSTFVPYRLMDPPDASLGEVPPGAPFAKLTDLGPIIVTEPRVQATVNVATFVGGIMSGVGREVERNGEKTIEGGVGPGCPVGYQVSGDRNHDEACELVYITDGTMINWLREGRLSRIGTVIVDEAHERSTNIDFILGYLKRELPRYPHLRVIVTSATFNTDFYQEYFGGPEVADVMKVPAVKSFGYGMPFFPELDGVAKDEPDVPERWDDPTLPIVATAERQPRDFLRAHWPQQHGPPFTESDVVDEGDIGEREDVWATTQKLIDLRFDKKIPIESWKEQMPAELTSFVIRLAKGLDREGIFGDILGFLPTTRTIEPACEEIERALGAAYRGHVFPLISSLPKDRQKQALKKSRKGDPRKIVISTNLAETSLTVEGVRFVVDTGIIAQSEWDPGLAEGGIHTKVHSRAGVKQRWGRVGRKAPGWVFPLYTKGQYLQMAEDTPPGSTRENLEALVMTAKMGGIDGVVSFSWPAAFEPTTTELDETAVKARDGFRRELARADSALKASGAVDSQGHPTSFGKELTRFQGLGSTASAVAVMYADRLACVPEVVTVLALLEDARLIGPRGLLHDDYDWPDEWRLEAAQRHRAIAELCEDDAHLALLVMGAWERADEEVAPWTPSERRRKWARRWFLNDTVLLEAAVKRQGVLAALSPAMKEEVKRCIEPALLDRARGVLTRALAGYAYRRRDDDTYESLAVRSPSTVDASGLTADGNANDQEADRVIASLEADQLTRVEADTVIALRRREARDDNRVSNLIAVQPWALPEVGSEDQPTGVADAVRLVTAAASEAAPDLARNAPLHLIRLWPVGLRIRATEQDGELIAHTSQQPIPPFLRPKTEEELGEPTRVRRRRQRRHADPDETGGTRADSDGEINPLGRRGGDPDEADEAAAALAEADRQVTATAPCGACYPCRDGREDDCEHPLTVDDRGRGTRDPLQSWRARSQNDANRATVVLRSDGDVDRSDGWYEVAGYQLNDGALGVRLAPDWRPEGFRGNPAQHVDVEPGQPVKVVVGALVSHHAANLRTFLRADGQGRFLVREASNRRKEVQEQRGEIAVSLSRGDCTLLEELREGETITATVVPARVDGCYTITLLELLHQHLMQKGIDGRTHEFHVLDPRNRNVQRSKLFTAVVESGPNEAGYATAVLLHQDTTRGIRHRFDLRAETDEVDEAEGTDDASADADGAEELREGQGLLLNLISDPAELEVGGLDLDAIHEIHRASNRKLQLRNVADDDALGSEHDADEDEPPTAPPGALLRSVSEDPLSRHAAQHLAALDESAAWKNEVWAFWARSHHLRVGWKPRAYLPGSATEPFDVRSEVEVSDEDDLQRLRRRIEEFATEHPVGSVVEGEVQRITDGTVFVQLTTHLDGRLPVRELSWRWTDHASDEVAPGEVLRLLVTGITTESSRPQIELSARALVPKPLEQFKARHRVGDVCTGRVRHATRSHAFVDLGDGVDGAIHVGEIAHHRVGDAAEELPEGTEVRAKILGFDDERDQVELSIRALLPKPYEVYESRMRVGERVKGPVRNATKSHVYVDLDVGVEGVVHVSKLSHSHVPDARSQVSVGSELTAEIIGFNDKREQVELSLKALTPEPYPAFKARTPVGSPVSGVVTGMNPSFVYVDLGEGVKGAIHIKNLSAGFVTDPSAVVTKGQSIRAVVISFNDQRRQVQLSLTATPPPRPAPQPRAVQQTSRPRPKRTGRGEGASIAEATSAAADRLGLTTSQVTVKVLRRAKKGLLGRVKQTAQVEVTEK